MSEGWDCIVIGAGAAGLSAALVLGRARRRTLLVDSGEQSNLPAEGIGGFLGADGEAPSDFYERSRAGLEKYPVVSFRAGSIVDGRDTGDGFELTTAEGELVNARCVLLATGMDYRRPSLPGVAERWGRSVFHCPFCHGWEVRDGALGVLDSGESGEHRALLLRSWSDDVTLYTNGGPAPTAELGAAGVAVDDRRVLELSGEGEELAAVRFEDGSARRCDGLLVPVTMHQRSELAARLGAELAEATPLAADAVVVDGLGATSVPGLYAAGDLNGRMPSVANAVASGSNAAAAIVQRLTIALAAS
ncbi:MAG TPA: NAD(P)/FAD-dependent oxidoreductase [Solirubrobacterales bacterium]|jgi:thioredoxin reductase|nr:NAD(P)/FAD-dependent oxidoreductase [Solirubrobacterales bacterium]